MNQDIYVVIEHLRGRVADISYSALVAARVLSLATGGKVVAILLGHQVADLAGNLAADEAWYIEHIALADFNAEAYERVLEALIAGGAPRAVLFGDTSIGADVAGWLASRLDLPLVSNCSSVRAEDDALVLVCQLCGGKLMAEGALPGPQALITMVPGGFKPEQGRVAQAPALKRLPAPQLDGLRLKVIEFVEPASGDVDISKEEILIAVGRGIGSQENVEMAEELAQALRGVLCGSRPVVDQGWLPTTRLVGKSGKSVKAKLYLALGVSGAPEHVEAISEETFVVPVNTDASAPIFKLARYGTQIDLVDLLPELTEQVRSAKAG
jgi:electron transfer flavoprotein alpha subunit